MGVVNYDSVDGEILGDSVSGDYLRDALGSVTGTCSPIDGTLRNTYRYGPNGSQILKTGTSIDPRFKWNGTSGCLHNSLKHSETYMRARHFGEAEGRWSAVDPLWPSQPAYEYCYSNPVTLSDPLGLAPCNAEITATLHAR